MKRILASVIVVLVVLVFSGCGAKSVQSPSPVPTTSATIPASSSPSTKPATSVPTTSVTTPSTSLIVSPTQPTTAASLKVPNLTQPVQLRIAAQSSGTSLYLWSAAQAEIFKAVLPKGSIVDVMTTGGAIANILMVNKGQAELGWSTKAVDNWGLQGITEAGFSEKITGVKTLATGFSVMQVGFFVTKKLGISSIQEIKAKKIPIKIGTLQPGSGGEVAARFLLAEYGMTYDDIKSWGGSFVHTAPGTIGDMIKNGTLDGAIGYWGPTHPTANDIFASRDMMILPVTKDHADNLSKTYGFIFSPYPAGSFKGVGSEVPTIGDSHEFFISPKIADDVAYVLAKALIDNRDRLVATSADLKPFSTKVAWDFAGFPLHPGAEKYYKEAGFMP